MFDYRMYSLARLDTVLVRTQQIKHKSNQINHNNQLVRVGETENNKQPTK